MLSLITWCGQAFAQSQETGSSIERGAEPIATTPIAGRHALVIGNSSYSFAPPLSNGTNDAAAIGRALEKLGFDVALSLDVNQSAMREAIEDFSRRLRPGDVSLFYYAGHGLQVNGTNYLIPVDAALERPVDLAFEGQRLDEVIDAMTAEENTAIILLDACRNNPFARNLSRAKKTRNMAVGVGLAPVDAGTGVYIGFATQPDNVAYDGEDGHSPFATALLRHIATPGLDIEILMRRVRADVMDATRQQQVPWSNSSLVEPGFAFLPRAEQDDHSTQRSPTAESDADLEFWKAVKDTSDIDMFRAYLAAFPTGVFNAIAKDRVSKLANPPAPKKKAPVTVKKAQPKPAVAAAPEIKPTQLERSTVSQPSGSTSGRRCAEGNILRCQQNCKAGRRGACRMLQKLQAN